LSVQELSVRLVPEPPSIGEARHFVHDALSVWAVDGRRADTVALLVSELVTNAIVHAVPPIDLTLDRKDQLLRVEVSDGANQMPEMIEPPRPAGGGYGLHLVEQLSDTWGIARRGPQGKLVWFEIELDPPQTWPIPPRP
jgi:anti-sigma regulatory factor (Ser/Thr protein kinase)